jgi:hypothetical protein
VRSPVEAYLGRLRTRAALLHGARALAAALGACALAFAAGALAVGPIGAPAIAFGAWLVVAIAAGAALVWGVRSFAPWRGAGAARLLAAVAPNLPSAARTASELSRGPDGAFSSAMIRAHEARVLAELAKVPPRTVVRWVWLRHPAVALGAAGLAILGVSLATERGSAGAYALVHPAERAAGGERIAIAFSGVRAHLVFPGYLDRAAVTIPDPTLLEVPRGTSIEITATPRIDAEAAELRIGDRTVPMERGGDAFVARFVAREDGALVLRARSSGAWVHDATARNVRTREDEAPRVVLSTPSEDLILDEAEQVAIEWEASDDVGIAHVELVVRARDGRESKRRVASPEGLTPSARGSLPLDLAALGLAPGDSVSIRIEARDENDVSGPSVGRSAERTITIASQATQRERDLASLEELLVQGLDLLAERLERPAPEAEEPARLRYETVASKTEAFVGRLFEHAENLTVREQARASDLALYREIAARVRRLAHEERMLHARRLAAHADRTELDQRAVRELEGDVLTLDDLLGRARVEDAAAIARELESLRREIHSLLAELRRADTPEARQRLMEAISRAEARMRELYARLSEMGTDVPREFANAGDPSGLGETANALAQLREAALRGDLDAADRLVTELQRQIDQLARMLGQTEESFVEAHFGERERAMAEALDTLVGLEAEQGQLAQRGVERRSRAAQRALEGPMGEGNRVGERLADQTRAVRDALDRVDRSNLASFEQEAFDRVRQRLVDAEDALRTGDLGEGQQMAEVAAQDLSGLSRDLDLSSLMFPGHEGETSADARSARAADQALSQLRQALDSSMPDVARHLEEGDRTEMRSDLSRQRETRSASERLAEVFDRGDEGTPLDPDASRELHEAAEAMQRAAGALEDGDPLEAARESEDASRRLTALRERLERSQSQSGGGSSDDGASSVPDMRRAVQIPGADQFEGPMEMRRRLLDAMRETAPRGYEDAVRRYYEGLLR